MDVRERIRLLRFIDKVKKKPEFTKELKVEADVVCKVEKVEDCSIVK